MQPTRFSLLIYQNPLGILRTCTTNFARVKNRIDTDTPLGSNTFFLYIQDGSFLYKCFDKSGIVFRLFYSKLHGRYKKYQDPYFLKQYHLKNL